MNPNATEKELADQKARHLATDVNAALVAKGLLTLPKKEEWTRDDIINVLGTMHPESGGQRHELPLPLSTDAMKYTADKASELARNIWFDSLRVDKCSFKHARAYYVYDFTRSSSHIAGKDIYGLQVELWYHFEYKFDETEVCVPPKNWILKKKYAPKNRFFGDGNLGWCIDKYNRQGLIDSLPPELNSERSPSEAPTASTMQFDLKSVGTAWTDALSGINRDLSFEECMMVASEALTALSEQQQTEHLSSRGRR